jgi:hypothetical protein
MIPRYIFCQCMKPWNLCVNKPNSYKIDVRDLLNSYNLEPYLHLGKNNYIDNPEYNINYDFINNKKSNIKFKCRRSLDKDKDKDKDSKEKGI